MARSRENPILILGFFLSLALFAWLAVYAYTYFWKPQIDGMESRGDASSELSVADGGSGDPNDPPVRVAYQPMPWPELMPGDQRIELQAHIQPYDAESTDFLCERMPQVKDVINLVLSQFDDESVALGLDLAVVEEQLAAAINQRLGEPVIRGTFIDVGTTSGAHERYRFYCRSSGGASGTLASGSGSGGSGSAAASGGSRSAGANDDLENWFVRAAKSRERRVERLRMLEELESRGTRQQ